MRIGECSNKWQIITWLALRGLREGIVSGAAADSVDHTAQHTVSSSVWHATRQLWPACCTFVLMIRQLSSLKMYFAKKLLLFLWGAIVIWPFAALNYSDSTRLASSCLASNCSWCWAGDEGIVCRMACSSFINCRLSLPRPPSPPLLTCNTCHVRLCATPTATVKTADNAMATASVTSLPSLPPSPPTPPPLLACRGACIIIIIYSCQQSEAEEEQPLPEDADWFSLQLNHVASLIWFSRRCV